KGFSSAAAGCSPAWVARGPARAMPAARTAPERSRRRRECRIQKPFARTYGVARCRTAVATAATVSPKSVGDSCRERMAFLAQCGKKILSSRFSGRRSAHPGDAEVYDLQQRVLPGRVGQGRQGVARHRAVVLGAGDGLAKAAVARDEAERALQSVVVVLAAFDR